jgi:predicted Zn finger-like uncharacterized protein
MKFNCDRCKTRYSISDERVRGKVLKIRCKICSAVITVREGMTASAPRTPRAASRSGDSAASALATARSRSDSALRGAFDDAMSAPSASDSMTGAPASLATEWYLAIDGNQSGPFDLGDAKGWIREQQRSAELYCWSEGFDDWLPIEKVSQFRGVRNGANGTNAGLVGIGSGTPMPAFDTEVEKTPVPLFAEAMKKVTAEAPTLLEDDDPMSPRYSGIDEQADAARADAGGAFEFDIGEASRVVNLASLMPPSGGLATPVAPSSYGLPGMAADRAAVNPAAARLRSATNHDFEALRAEVVAPAIAKRSRVLLPLLIASGALVLVLGVLLFLAFREGETEEEIARGGGRVEDLAHRYDLKKTPDGKKSSVVEDEATTKATKPKAGGGRTSTPPNGSGQPSSDIKAGYVPPSDEVDLSRTGDDDVRRGGLQPSDIVTVYRKSQFSVNRCYERAIKKDPLLKVGRANVSLNVTGSGVVDKVTIPSLAGESLGSCLVVAIGRWRFPKSTEGFRGSFPIVFKGN